MRIQSFQYMQTQYGGNRDLEPDDLEERKKLLTKYKYSIIVETEHLELDNLYKWIKQNIGMDQIKDIYYGKIGYDYGFIEFFINERIHEEKMRFAIPNIYTNYPNSNRRNKICKSDGYESNIGYNPEDKNAIIFPDDENS